MYNELYKKYDSSIHIYNVMRSWWQAGTLFFYIFSQCYSLYYYLFHIININICGMPLSINISYIKSEIKFLLNEWNGKFISKAHFASTNGYCKWASSVPLKYYEKNLYPLQMVKSSQSMTFCQNDCRTH